MSIRAQRVYRPPVPPSQPTLTATTVTSSSILLTALATPAPGQAIVAYTFERSATQVGPFSVVQSGASATYLDSGLAPLTTWFYRARAQQTDLQIGSYNSVMGVTTLQPPATGFDPAWPRIAGVPLNNPDYERLDIRQHWSRFHIVCFTHYHTWQSGRSMNMEQVMQDMKARAPASLGVTPLHVIYTIKDETYTVPDGATQRLHDKLNAENWWLRFSFPAGGIVPHEFPGNSVINDSSYCPNDSTGRNWNLWIADLHNTQNRIGEPGNSPNSSVDGFSCDVIIWKPRWDGDYNRDGTSDSRDNATIQYALREGQKQYFDRLQAAWPTGYRFANTDFGQHQGANLYNAFYTVNPSAVAPMNGVLQGTQMEYMLSDASAPYAYEYQARDPGNGLAGFYAMRNSYEEYEAAVQAPKLNIFFDHQAFTGTSAAAWQATRFGMACCWALGNAFAYQQPNSFSATLFNWADEYDKGGVAQGWMGWPDAGAFGAPRQVYKNGVYRRDFDNAVVLLNPRNNGAQSIALPFATRRITGRSGFSDTSVNNGALIPAGTLITLQDRDALILIREAASFGLAPMISSRFENQSLTLVGSYSNGRQYRPDGTDSTTGRFFGQHAPILWNSAPAEFQALTDTSHTGGINPDNNWTTSFVAGEGLLVTRNSAYIQADQFALRYQPNLNWWQQGMLHLRGWIKPHASWSLSPGQFIALCEVKVNGTDQKIEFSIVRDGDGTYYERVSLIRANGGGPVTILGSRTITPAPVTTFLDGAGQDLIFTRGGIVPSGGATLPVGSWWMYELAMRTGDASGQIAGRGTRAWVYAASAVGTPTVRPAAGSATQRAYFEGQNIFASFNGLAPSASTIVFPQTFYTDAAVQGLPLTMGGYDVSPYWPSDASPHPSNAV